jgi:TolA-binding protein
LGACASQRTSAPEPTALEQRLQKLEGRIESLERRDTIEPQAPYRSREEIAARIRALETERDTLLIQYTSAHPAVRDVDRRLRILREQIQMPDSGPSPPR